MKFINITGMYKKDLKANKFKVLINNDKGNQTGSPAIVLHCSFVGLK